MRLSMVYKPRLVVGRTRLKTLGPKPEPLSLACPCPHCPDGEYSLNHFLAFGLLLNGEPAREPCPFWRLHYEEQEIFTADEEWCHLKALGLVGSTDVQQRASRAL